jgi:hypothetical protein
MTAHTCQDYPKPSTDPADFRCPRCHAAAGARCGVLQGVQLRHPHGDRIDTMIRAHSRWAKSPEHACQLDGPCSV